jgi:hypothetical protein
MYCIELMKLSVTVKAAVVVAVVVVVIKGRMHFETID